MHFNLSTHHRVTLLGNTVYIPATDECLACSIKGNSIRNSFFMGCLLYLRFNPFQPNISMHILHAVIYAFPEVLKENLYQDLL